MSDPQQSAQPQPFLPRIGMVWFFIVVAVVSVALFVIRAADQGRALSAALVFTGLFFLVFCSLSAIFFLIAYTLGAVEKAVSGGQEQVASPFIDGKMPDEVLLPKPADEQ